MPKWTNEQLEAIEKEGSNIIVSAGAGSGKTAVLTERVINKLQNGVKINELLILTFTNAAAGEMKDRIRSKIMEHENLKDNLDLLESSYITTFDSFTLSLVKKYNYLLNVSSSLSIIDAGIIGILKEEVLDQIFDEYYLKNDKYFNKLINDFCIKNDGELKKSILKIINALELKSDKETYLNEYLDTYFTKDYLDSLIKEYLNLIESEIKSIETNLYYLSESDFPDFYMDMSSALDSLIKSKTYADFKQNINITLPRRPKDSDDIKKYKDAIDASLKVIKEYLRFESVEEINETFMITKDYLTVIISIIRKFNQKLWEYKYQEDLYEFTDIELLAINLLKEHPDIRNELKDFYQEIMVDEYQDTNDLQEEFINLIQNNNVYMVGDIKQSIYGFRNANPRIFKQKYNDYAQNNGGIKIDLLKNFRSRKEVLSGINEIFNLIMDNFLGGADYIKSHQMLFGNNLYEENKSQKQNYDLEILNYPNNDNKYTNEAIESFIIGQDILKKINDGYEVLDKKSGHLRQVTFADFCIIMDRGTAFTNYKKVFEYLHIPLTIYEDQKLTSETDTLLINNILGLILKIRSHIIDTEFKYFFMSIARSYLFALSDNEILKIFNENTFKETKIYQICAEIALNVDNLNVYQILKQILDKFAFYEKIIKVGNVNDRIIRFANLLNVAKTVGDIGYTPEDFKEYLLKMINSNMEITYKDNNSVLSGVKIMNIHKSKGLEFPVCYFSGFHKAFNTSDIKERFVYDNTYGIITPFFKEGIGSTILKDLLKNQKMAENIAERIRLLYVALTRCKEKMIIVTSLDENRCYAHNLVDLSIRQKYNSFLSIINSISGNLDKYIHNINLNSLNLSKDYLNNQIANIKLDNRVDKTINFKKINIQNNLIEEKHASKTINNIITKEEKDALKYGTYIHEIFENTNFLNIPKDSPYYDLLHEFTTKLNITKDTKIYQEHEFMYEKDKISYHGIIDLVLVDEDIVKIIDYKLKNIDDDNYVKQLNIYKEYLSLIFTKPIKTYLYSIINNELKEIG